MTFRHLPARLIVSTALVASPFVTQEGHAQAVSAQDAANAALALFNEGQFEDAAKAYAEVIKNYPTSTVIAEAEFRLGYALFFVGDYDESLKYLKKASNPPAPVEIQELAKSITPQSLAAKASKEKNEAKQKSLYEEAVKAYDAFLAEFPRSEQVESATYGKAMASFQLGNAQVAIDALKSNLKNFPRSETVQDSQYLLALILATEGMKELQADRTSSAGLAKCDQAEKYLRGIVSEKKDVALSNDAQFQLAEILFNRGLLGTKEQQVATWEKAMEGYRSVQPKEPMIAAQTDRIAGVKNRQKEALTARNFSLRKQLQRVEETERGKLEALKAKEDITLEAHIKMAQILFQLQAYDETRVLLRQMEKFASEEAQKKTIKYYKILSYASQQLRDPAVALYNEYKENFKDDTLGDNLPLVIGSLYLGGEPQPDTAIEVFQEGAKLYPKGRFASQTLNAQATALLQLKRYDEAAKAYRDFLATNPTPEEAVQAQFGLATIDKDTGKVDEAIAAFRKIREAHPKTEQGEQSSFWIGLLLIPKGDGTAVQELKTFLENYPQSTLYSIAKFQLGGALVASDKAQALQIFKEVADQFPDSEAAPYTYFQRASLLAADNKQDEMLALMKEFITKYPKHPFVFNAYDSIGQNLIANGKPQEAIANYLEMANNLPDDPNSAAALFQVARLWKSHTEAQGRYLALNEEQRVEWNKGITECLANVERLLETYPTSPQVALALEEFLACQKLLLAAQLKKDEEITQSFETLAAKFNDKPEAKNKILFTLASYIYEKDKALALEKMRAAYDETLVYGAKDMDLFGTALIETDKDGEAFIVYTKLANDYPIPAGTAPTQAPPQVQEAQSISLFGIGKSLQKQGKVAEAGAQFVKLKELYPWSPKIQEADFGIAESLFQQGNVDEANRLLGAVVRSHTASVELRAKANLLIGDIWEKKGDLAAAIDNYIKVPVFYASAAIPAADGLFKGAQLLEKQAATLPATADPKNPKGPTKGGQLQKAIKAYRDLIANYPNSNHVPKAKERLAVLAPAPAK